MQDRSKNGRNEGAAEYPPHYQQDELEHRSTTINFRDAKCSLDLSRCLPVAPNPLMDVE